MGFGAFLLKDENTDSDVLTDISCSDNSSVFAAVGRGEDVGEEGLTASLVSLPSNKNDRTRQTWSSQASPSSTTISRASYTTVSLRIGKMLKSPVRSSVLIVSLYHSNHHNLKTQYNRFLAQIRHFNCRRRESHPFTLSSSIFALNNNFFSKAWMFPLTSQGCCSSAQVRHHSLDEDSLWTYSKKTS